MKKPMLSAVAKEIADAIEESDFDYEIEGHQNEYYSNATVTCLTLDSPQQTVDTIFSIDEAYILTKYKIEVKLREEPTNVK